MCEDSVDRVSSCHQSNYGSASRTKIGYLVPEFPGQTHNFFWRERKALKELGVETSLISTRRPPLGVVSPTWAKDAQTETTYLFPFSFFDFLRAFIIMIRAGVCAWINCAKIITSVQDATLAGKVRLTLLIPFAAKLVWVSQRQGWRHVHVHSCADAANIAMLANALHGPTYSLTLHNPLSVYGPNQRQKWSRARFCIVITRKLYDEVTRTLVGFLPSRLVIAPMGVDVVQFNRHAPYRPYAGEGELCVFSCGRLNPSKGFPFLISAIKLLVDQGVNVRLTIAGEDDVGGTGYRRKLVALTAESGVSERVAFLGAVPEEIVSEHLEQAHVFVLASLAEPLGVALMEAMAMSVPVVATDGGGVPELIENGADGILVEPGDANAIAVAIMRVIGDPLFAVRLGQASRFKIVESFGHQRSARAIADLLAAR
jgi:colanic acid/amylovoran biosynthesis glycosyltransferase